MIVELVTFRATPGADRDAILAEARATIPRWRANPQLVRKHYLLSEDGSEPDQLNATATVDFVPGEGVKSSRIVVHGRVSGINQSRFEEAAQAAAQNCPISGALQGNIDISVDATLES